MHEKEFDWFLQHPELEEEYSGEYIAIVNQVVVAHGKDFASVLEEARKHGDEPLFHKVPAADKEQIVWSSFRLDVFRHIAVEFREFDNKIVLIPRSDLT